MRHAHPSQAPKHGQTQAQPSPSVRRPAAVAALAAPTTGLPAALQAGLESLSGLRLDAVRVHGGSDLPAGMGALASAQGQAIHLAPGQERHLAHEAWHVVQQAQGRVRSGLPWLGGSLLNTDPALEHEADVMGAHAAALGASLPAVAARPAALRPLPVQPAPAALQLLTVNTKNMKQVEKLQQRHAKTGGTDKAWKALLGGATSLSDLESKVGALETPASDEPQGDKAKVDKHGGKHLRGRKKGDDARTVIEKTKTSPATFYASVDYEALLQQVVKAAVAAGTRFCEVGHAVGADQGAETTLVELYGDATLGYHMRPKNPDYIKNYGKQTIATLD